MALRLRIARGVELRISSVYLALDFTCKKLVGSISRNSPIQCKESFCVRSTLIENIFPHVLKWSTLANMEHQKFNENLKSTQVSNPCHIYGLLFYALIESFFGCESQVFVENNAANAQG
jgi:hypothetical protein